MTNDDGSDVGGDERIEPADANNIADVKTQSRGIGNLILFLIFVVVLCLDGK